MWPQHQPGRAQGMFEQHSQARGVTLGNGVVQGWDLYVMVFVDPFQLSILCNSLKIPFKLKGGERSD